MPSDHVFAEDAGCESSIPGSLPVALGSRTSAAGTPATLPLVLRQREMSALLGISTKAVIEKIRNGDLPGRIVGRTAYCPSDVLFRFLAGPLETSLPGAPPRPSPPPQREARRPTSTANPQSARARADRARLELALGLKKASATRRTVSPRTK